MSDAVKCSEKILVGTAGWSYADWEGVFYPSGMQRRREHPLTYLAQYFDMAEVNASFYGPIKPEWVKIWAKRVDAVNPRFKFTAKLHNSFTHASRDMPGPTSAASINPTAEGEIQVREGLSALAATGKLGVILAQFPLSYRNTPLNREYLATLAQKFGEFPLAIEVRDESWGRPEVAGYFTELKVAFCNIDFVSSSDALAPTELLTAPVGYVRLHGRNNTHDYLYSLGEMRIWAEKITRVANFSDVTYTAFNNTRGARAVVNALQMKAILTGSRIGAPEPLLKGFPELREVADPMDAGCDGLSFSA